MKEYMIRRVLGAAEYIIDTGATVRSAAAVFGISKSTVHKDMTERLPLIDPAKGDKVAAILKENLAQRHIRGGIATREKYLRRSQAESFLRE